MDQIVLTAHSILRYGVLIFGLYAITKSILGVVKKQQYTKMHNLSATLFVAFMHLQVLLGLILYFTRGFYKNIEMGSTVSRFWGIEHIFGMILAAVLIQIGRSKSKKQFEHHNKHKTSLKWFVIGFIIILATIPWPFREILGRGWWPMY